MSMHREDYARIAQQIGDTIKAHPMPFLIIAAVVMGFVFGAILL